MKALFCLRLPCWAYRPPPPSHPPAARREQIVQFILSNTQGSSALPPPPSFNPDPYTGGSAYVPGLAPAAPAGGASGGGFVDPFTGAGAYVPPPLGAGGGAGGGASGAASGGAGAYSVTGKVVPFAFGGHREQAQPVAYPSLCVPSPCLHSCALWRAVPICRWWRRSIHRLCDCCHAPHPRPLLPGVRCCPAHRRHAAVRPGLCRMHRAPRGWSSYGAVAADVCWADVCLGWEL